MRVYAQMDVSAVNWLQIIGFAVNPIAGAINYLMYSTDASSFKQGLNARGYSNIELRVESSLSVPRKVFLTADVNFDKSNSQIQNDIRSAAYNAGYLNFSDDSIYVQSVPSGTSLQQAGQSDIDTNACQGFDIPCYLGISNANSALLGFAIGGVLLLLLLNRR